MARSNESAAREKTHVNRTKIFKFPRISIIVVNYKFFQYENTIHFYSIELRNFNLKKLKKNTSKNVYYNIIRYNFEVF